MRNLITLVERLSHSQMIDIASGVDDQFGQNEKMGGPATRYTWRFEPSYSILKLTPPADSWAEFMTREIESWSNEGDPHRYDDEVNNPTREPVVIVEVDGRAYLWDGNHRVGGTALGGRSIVPAIVGTPKA